MRLDFHFTAKSRELILGGRRGKGLWPDKYVQVLLLLSIQWLILYMSI